MEVVGEINAAIGGMILANLATIGSVIYVGAKTLWWASQQSFKTEQNIKDINEAHKKIRDIEGKLNDF